MKSRLLFAALLCARALPAAAAESEFEGSWLLTIDAPGIVPYEARLDIERDESGYRAWVENGPAPIDVDGDTVTFRMDSRDRQGFRFERELTGRLEDDVITGTMTMIGLLDTAAENGEDGASWTAIPVETVPDRDSSGHTLSDYDGIWVGIRGRDVRKYTMDLTPEAKAWVEAYDARMDEPQKRCVSPGLVAAVTWIFPFEIIVSEERGQVTMLYEAFGLSRRVFMDRDEMPEFYPESSMGYSRGRMDDGELVIETTLLSPSVRDFNGEPVTEETRIVERYYLTDDGERLNLVMRMHDPSSYRRPPIRRRAWAKDDDALIFPFECDPDSFFRQLYTEGLMQDYIDRAHMRP